MSNTNTNTKTPEWVVSIALVVTTEHRGVFFGYGKPTEEKTIVLTGVRMCVYWPTSVHGVMGLATSGPLSGSRVSPAVPEMTLQDVTGVMQVTEEAVKQWEKGPWS